MSRLQIVPGGLQIRSARRISIVTLVALVGIVLAAVMFNQAATSPDEAFAAPSAGNEPWLEINCLEDIVEEGEDFRLIVNKKFDSEWPHETIRVFWYTDPITADETDYEHLYAVRQSSNGYQSRHGRMGRDFHTLEDQYPEVDETFIVRFNNSVDYGHDGECTITITDDDGIGIYNLEITSTPHLIPGSGSQQPQVGYAVGDLIEITAHFNGDVTTVNPATGQQSHYAGIYIQVGENRRFAPFLRNYGPDALVFGYTVRPDDLDTNGISVEDGGPGTGLGYSPEHRDGGIWIADTGSSRINRLFHGLGDDPAHRVFQIELDEPTTIIPPTENDTETLPQPEPEAPEWVRRSVVIENPSFHIEHGELTGEDGGRDWFSFEGEGGQDYIIEVESRMELLGDGGTPYVEDKLIDPSILEIVDEEGAQVLGEQDNGGFIYLWARGYFTPRTDGQYYVAVGSGNQLRGGLGHYTISVRQDDHADDSHTNAEVTLRPGQQITGRINSDIPPTNVDPHAWAWAETTQGNAVPRWGLESADDKDVIRFEIAEAGEYLLAITEGPTEVGLWAIFLEQGGGFQLSWEAPVRSHTEHLQPGTHYVGIGTPYRSVGSTGAYTLALAKVPNGESGNGG